jgi:hypothetical protein
MRIVHVALAGGMLAAIAVVASDNVQASDLSQPYSVRQTAFEYDSYTYFAPEEASPSPSDQPVATDGCRGPMACEPAACDPRGPAACDPCGGMSCAPSCGSSCRGCGGGLFGCCIGDPWELPEPCALQCRGITWGGWVSAGILANSRGNASNGPLGFNDLSQFDAHQVWFYLDKEVDTSETGWDIGGHVDFVFGVDGPDTQAFGDQDWDFGWGGNNQYGWAMPQLYATIGVGDWTVKAGHFYTIIGWEVVQAPDNFFYSHAYTMYYGEPFTHTGFLAERGIGDRLTVRGGWVTGWDGGFRNLNDASMFIGGFSYELTDRATFTYACTAGNFGDGTQSGNIGDLYMHSLVFEYALTDRLTYILQHDNGQNWGTGGNDSQWYGLNQYITYQLNDCWGFGTRMEWFRDDDGARIGDVGDYYEVTCGLNYKPTANLTIRPELRYDWYKGNGTPFPGNNVDQFTGGFDFIATW